MNSIASPGTKHNHYHFAPETAPCPTCGTFSPRNEIRRLERWAANLERAERKGVDVGCYICPVCPEGSRWFRLEPPGFEGWRDYTTSTRHAVLSLVTVDKMSFEGATSVGHRLLHLPELAATTVLRWYREEGGEVDYRGHLERVAEVFSGQLAIDEVYDGGFYVIKATDPLNGIELTSRIGEGSPEKAHIIDVLLELKQAGIYPQLIVTDGSPLYPNAIREVFPQSEHQRCVFHFLQGTLRTLGKAFWAAYATMPPLKKRKRGRPKKRGRPRLDKQKRDNREKVRACRYLIFKKGGLDASGHHRLSEDERDALATAIRLCPPLGEMRRLVEAIYELFGPTTDSHDVAEARRRSILADESFNQRSDLAGVLRDLADDDLFGRLTRYLDFEDADKTSNHPERENREFRKRQRSHYRLRSLASLCSFLDILLVRRAPPAPPRRLTKRRKPSIPPDPEVLAA